MNIPYVPSPNRSKRPEGYSPSLIVLHSTDGDYSGSLSWLTNRQSRVSAHYLVSRKGTVVKLVPTQMCAWHAGVSSWNGRSVKNSVNGFSIGIEMEHLDGRQDWPEAQLAAVAELCGELCAVYGIPKTAIAGHYAVAPGRKVDPVSFPWSKFYQLI